MVKRSLKFAALCACFASLMTAAAVGAHAQAPLKKVRIVIGTGSLNISYPTLNLPRALGYWKEEGYDVEVTPLAPPAQSIALLIAGQTEFAQLNASSVVQAQSLRNENVKLIMSGGVIDWSLGVLADSPIKSVADLKGKSIGVFGLASGGVAYLKSYLQENGIDPDKDVTLIATGGGAPAIDALRSGRVQGLMYWAAAMASYENAGLKMRYIRSEQWKRTPDLSIAVMGKTIESDPKMVEGIVRGMAKAHVFAFANPDCVRRVQWKTYPTTKPTGADEATLATWDINILNAQLQSFRDGFQLNGGKLMGFVDPAPIAALEQFMLTTKQIEKLVPPQAFVGADAAFYQRVNNFDANAIKASAEKCVGF